MASPTKVNVVGWIPNPDVLRVNPFGQKGDEGEDEAVLESGAYID